MASFWNLPGEPARASPARDASSKLVLSSVGVDLFNVALDTLTLHRQAGAETAAEGGSGTAAGASSNVGVTVLGQRAEYRHASSNWRKVASNARALRKDNWAAVVETTPTERAIEHVYDVLSGQWSSRRVLVRVNTEDPVAKGRMRECFQLKMVAIPASSNCVTRSASIASASSATTAASFGDAVQQDKFERIVFQLSQGAMEYTTNYTARDMAEWASICQESVLTVLTRVGRKTLCRVRAKLGLVPVSFRHPTILTVGEVMDCARRLGTREVQITFAEECHGFTAEDVSTLGQLIRRGLKDDACWVRPSLNYMAKRYMSDVDDTLSVYQEDVVMQEVCKRLCLQFNSFTPAPPKKIDMLHVGLVQLVDRDNQPFLGYESFVQGEYRKWNTNSGWRDEKIFRHTPHAFSFASFRMTKGELMVVDVQGVNDLYTDPQVHSRDGAGFGEGNLGARGMALFLRSFRFDLNPVVQYMKLVPFVLLAGEQPPASAEELAKFDEGKAYLASRAWQQRTMLSPQSSLEQVDAMVVPALALCSVDSSANSTDDPSCDDDDDDDDEEEEEEEEETSSTGHGKVQSKGESQWTTLLPPGAFSEVNAENPSAAAAATRGQDPPFYLSAVSPPCHELNAFPAFLLKCSRELRPLQCPRHVRSQLPDAETAEAAVHWALAQLYEEADERVADCQCDMEEAARFHIWLAALGGNLDAQIRCATAPEADPASALNWAHVAALRGSRTACLKALSLVDQADVIQCMFYLQKAIECKDGKTEQQRKADMEVCSHELHFRLANAFLGIGERRNAITHYQEAAEFAMEAGDFRLHEKYIVALEEV